MALQGRSLRPGLGDKDENRRGNGGHMVLYPSRGETVEVVASVVYFVLLYTKMKMTRRPEPLIRSIQAEEKDSGGNIEMVACSSNQKHQKMMPWIQEIRHFNSQMKSFGMNI